MSEPRGRTQHYVYLDDNSFQKQFEEDQPTDEELADDGCTPEEWEEDKDAELD